jgi:hypothetical protein
MNRGQYLRLTSYIVPFPCPYSFANDLATVAILSTVLWCMEGWLRNSLLVGGRIDLAARVREGQPCKGIFRSLRIERIEGQYVLTHGELYHFVRVPPLHPDNFTKFA